MVASLSSSVTTFVRDHGLAAVFFLMLVDAVFPAASELVMVVGGALAAGAFGAFGVSLFGAHIPGGFWAYVAVSLAGTIGYLFGAILGWAIGRYGGRPFLERHGRWLHLSRATLERAERWFERHGDWAVFLGRITPVVRSFVSIPAGVFRVSYVRYVVLTLIGSALWCFAFAGAGWAAGASYERFHHDFRYVEYAVVAGIVALAAYLFVRLRRSSTMHR